MTALEVAALLAACGGATSEPPGPTPAGPITWTSTATDALGRTSAINSNTTITRGQSCLGPAVCP